MQTAVSHDRPASAVPPAVQVFTLGGFRVLVNGQPLDEHAWRRTSARQLFKCLLCRPSRCMTRDEIVDLLWPDSDPDAASSNLRSTIYALRRALEPSNGQAPGLAIVFGDRASVWLRTDVELWLDADEFERNIHEAWRSSDALPLLQSASALYNGHFLPDDIYEDWATERREALKQRWAELEIRLSRELERRGDPESAAHQLQRLLQVDPCDERAAQEAMRLLARNGRRAEALRVYQRLAQALSAELEVAPAEETQALHRQITSGQLAGPPSASTYRCAYPFPTPTELIGRDAELEVLQRILEDGESGGRAALVGAPAGTGKSALVGQVVRQAEERGILCLAGGCYEERGAVPLGPFHDALVDYLLSQPAERIRIDLGNSATDLARVIPELRYQLNLADEPTLEPLQADRMRVFGAVHALLRSLCEHGETLVCLEDLHAADEATLQLFHYLVRQARRLPLVLIGTYRSDEAPAGQPLGRLLTTLGRERLVEHVRLPALDRVGTNRLVTSLLDGSPSDPLTDSVFTATAGNPLFVEQLVLALSEAGQLQQRAGLWHGEKELSGTPPIVGEVIAQRLLRLTDSCRNTLAVAAVLGQAVDYEVLLTAVEPTEESMLLADLDQAIGASILQEMPGGYAFRHALMRDAVYWSLSTPRRMLLHGRAGQSIEHLRGERANDYSAVLAYHYTHAGESASVRSKALQYSMQAGRRAAELSSYPESLVHYNQAWGILERDRSLASLEVRIQGLSGRGLAEANLAHYQNSVASYREVLELTSDPIQRARARTIIAFSLSHTGAFHELIQECEAGLAEVRDLSGSDATEIRVMFRQLIGLALLVQGRFRKVIELGRQLEEEAASAGPGPRSYAHLVIGWGYKGQGQVAKAIEQFKLAVAQVEHDGDKNDLAVAYESLGLQHYLGGSFASAREYLGRALALFHESATEMRAVNAIHSLCRVWVAEGEHMRASEQILRALEMEMEGRQRWIADAHHILGTIQVLRADWQGATASFEQALQICEQSGHMMGRVEATVALGFVDQCVGRWASAYARYVRAVQIANEMDPSPQKVLAERSLGRFRLLAGDRDEADRALEAALGLAETMSATLEYAPTLLAVAELRAVEGQPDEALALARRALDHARPVAQTIDANIVLARVHLALGNVVGTERHATEAVAGASRLGSPWLLSQAHLVWALAAQAQDADQARAAFEISLRHADEAGTPYERATALKAFASYLKTVGEDLDLARSMEGEALVIGERLSISGRESSQAQKVCQ